MIRPRLTMGDAPDGSIRGQILHALGPTTNFPPRCRDVPRWRRRMAVEDPYIGVRIEDGGYKLVAKIGEGGMGVVYRGVQDDTGTEVAVKILHVKYALEHEF